MAHASAVFFVILVASPLALASASPKAPPRLLLRSDSDDPESSNSISELIENIRRIIREGSDTLPVLDPFQLDSISSSFSEAGAYEVTGGLHNVVSTGLGDFNITMSSRQIQIIPQIQVEVTTELTLPILHASGGYFFDALLGEVVHLYGDGNMKLDITEIKVRIVAIIRVRLSSSELISLDAIIDVDGFEFDLDGLLERGPIDGIFSLVVNELAKVIFQGQKANIEEYLADILEEPVSEAIKDMGISDLLPWGFVDSDSGVDDGNSAVRSQRVQTLESKQAGVFFHRRQ